MGEKCIFFQSVVPQEGFSFLPVELNSTGRKDRGEGRWNVSPTSPKRRAILWAAAFLCSPRSWRSSLWCGIHRESWQLLPQGRRRKQRQRIIHAGPRYCRHFKMCWKVACLCRETEFWCYQLPGVPRRWLLSLSLATPDQEKLSTQTRGCEEHLAGLRTRWSSWIKWGDFIRNINSAPEMASASCAQPSCRGRAPGHIHQI